MNKKCSKCCKIQPLNKFSKDKNKGDGLCCQCKLCDKEYYIDNHNKKIKYQQQWNINHHDEILKYQQQYYKNNKDEIKQYYKNNKNKIKQYYKNNKEYIQKRNKIWQKNNPDKLKKIIRKSQSIRRGFGKPHPINKPFPNSHLHHLHINNSQDCIYIYNELHNSIYHSHKNKTSMKKINKVAFEWLCLQEIL